VPAIIPSILGTALSFFIGFNNNQAYGRWWEARKIWGALVNDSRTWARQVLFYTQPTDGVPDNELNPTRSKLIKRHIAFLYALKSKLRYSNDQTHLNFINDTDKEYLSNKSNKANAILDLQTKDLGSLYKDGILDGFRFIELNQMVVNFCDGMGKSERIMNTVFPTSYNFYTRIFTWIFIISVTMYAGNFIGYWSILIGTLVGYVFLTTEKIGYALLNPFEDLPTGIALNNITRTIEINLLETLERDDIPRPIESVKGEYIM
jgi:putative membrane protein